MSPRSLFSRLHLSRQDQRSTGQGPLADLSHPIAPSSLPASTLPERLWTRAYNKLQQHEPTLVEAYNAILSHKLNEHASTSIASEFPESTIDQIGKLVKDGLEKTKTSVKVKQSIGDAMQPVLLANNIISSAIQTAPQAAFAWTVFCFALQIFLNPLQEAKANRDGIGHIIITMDWYWHTSSLLLDENVNKASMGLRDQLENRIVDLYAKLLSYQMKSICSYYRNQGLVILRDIIKLDDWNDELKAVHNAENAVREYSAQYNTLQIRDNLNQLVDIARNQETNLLQNIYHTLRHQAEREDEKVKGENKEKDNQCLKDLCVTNANDDMTRIETMKGGLLEDSYVWILSHRDFIDWRDKDETRLLWIRGDPGKGKTMLLIGVVKELQKLQSAPNSALLSYFFCQGTDSRLNKATAVLRGLIYQLLAQQQSLIAYLRERYDKEKQLFEGVNAFYALQDIFTKMLDDPCLAKIYLVVDALDECESGLSGLVHLIRNTSTSSSRVKWLVSSRDRLDIEVGLRINDGAVECSLELNAESVSGAVDAYINYKVSELTQMKGYDSKLQNQVRDQLHQKASETFLWVALVCKELGGEVENWEVLELLQEVPCDLTLMYARMIEQIRQLKRRNPIYCMRILSVSTLAYRPFHWVELAAALPKDVPCERDNLIKIARMCGSFLTIREDTIYFIHQSAKDYLNSTSVVGSTTIDRLIFPRGRSEVHYEIVSRLLQNMEENLRRDIYDLHDPGISIDEVNPVHPDPLAQIRYASVYWIDHLCEIDSNLYVKVGLCDNGRIHQFLMKHFLHWLEALSLMRSMSEGVVMMRKLEGLLSNTAADLLSMIRDANRFILYNRFIIENSPLQVYASALVFCPTKSGIRKLFQDETPQWITTSPAVDEHWSPCLWTLEGHTYCVTSVAFSPDGRYLASGSFDETVRIWDVETGALQRTLEGHTDGVFSVSFSPDGRRLASGSCDTTVRIWGAETETLQRTLEGHKGPVLSVSYSPGGLCLASGSDDKTVRIWDTETGALQQTLEGHTDQVRSVAFSPDGRRLASGSDDNMVRIWDSETGALQRTLDCHTSWVRSVAFSPDGRHLASGYHTVQIWDLETGALQLPLEACTDTTWSVSFSPDGRRLASGGHTVRIWDAETRALQWTLEGHTSWVRSVAFSPDGRHLASGSGDDTVRIWDVETGAPQRTLEGHTGWVWSVALSPAGGRLASCSYDKTVRIWDLDTGALQRTLEGHADSIHSVSFSPDGRRLASGSSDMTVRIWDSETGALQWTLEGHTSWVRSVAFSPDERRLASGSNDKTVRIWDMETGGFRRSLEGHTGVVLSVAFSPDGRRLASGSETVRIWDVETAALQWTLEGHTNWVLSVAFSPDGRRLACGSNDMMLRICDAETGALRGVLEIGTSLCTLSFSSDGCNLITELGCIVLDQGSLPSSSLPIRTPNWSGYCLHVNRSWITWNEKNILWLPPEYRPASSICRKGTIAIGCSGRVLLISGNTEISL